MNIDALIKKLGPQLAVLWPEVLDAIAQTDTSDPTAVANLRRRFDGGDGIAGLGSAALAQHEIDHHNFAQAAEHATEAIACGTPLKEWMLALRGAARCQLGDLYGARRDCWDYYDQTDSGEALLWLAQLLAVADRHSDAAAFCERYLATKPCELRQEAERNLALALLNCGEYDRAHEVIARHMAEFGDQAGPSMWLYKGLAEFNLDRPLLARACLQRFLESGCQSHREEAEAILAHVNERLGD